MWSWVVVVVVVHFVVPAVCFVVLDEGSKLVSDFVSVVVALPAVAIVGAAEVSNFVVAGVASSIVVVAASFMVVGFANLVVVVAVSFVVVGFANLVVVVAASFAFVG